MSLSKPLDKVMELRDKEGKPKVALKELLKYKNEDFKEYDELIKYVLMKAVLYRDTGDMESSVETYKEALSIVKDDDHINKADILRSLSFVSIYTEGFEKAYEYALGALNILKDKRGKKYYRVKSNIYAVIGNILYGEERYEEALTNYKKGMYWAENDHFYQREITLGGDIANVYIAQKKYFKAIAIISKNLKLAKKSYRISVPQLYLRRAKIYFQTGDVKKAVNDIEKGIDISKKEGWFRDLGEAYEAMGDVLKEKGDTKFKQYYKKAEKIYMKGKYITWLNRVQDKIPSILLPLFFSIFPLFLNTK